MRLSALLAQYLYQHKRLDLPGLGTFIMDSSSHDQAETGRHAKTIHMEQIHFEPNPGIRESPELVSFISAQTGKIKALATADLDSHLELINQFLNIGKPFAFEGIGTITKIKAGDYTFTPGQAIAELKKEQPVKETAFVEDTREDYNYKSIFTPKKTTASWKKPLAVFLLVAGLVLAIWGGYEVYKRSKAKNENKESEVVQEKPVPLADSTVAVNDTLTPAREQETIPAGNYKFIIETANKERAIPRFKQLKEYQWKVEMETKDSLTYKIFMVLPASATDTTRIMDSLRKLTGRKVYIE